MLCQRLENSKPLLQLHRKLMGECNFICGCYNNSLLYKFQLHVITSFSTLESFFHKQTNPHTYSLVYVFNIISVQTLVDMHL
ncbi:hypothetical protein Patl1_24618 [Pistacia atlantica]|uniref:Uncharacterized protein n=1 Tax=Pistacia atlantica TaxID=434234 RepID=A0ACC0ZWQ4_9ROSI|nr:hypothetical protein Patl1_24618 [Pistacia atlantica]